MSPWSRVAAIVKAAVSPIPAGLGIGYGTVRESYPGAWQQNVEVSSEGALANFAVFACITRIAQDIAKIGFLLEEKSDEGIWTTVEGFSPYRQVFDSPNQFQTHVQFKEAWLLSKLRSGNAYLLKQRDLRGIVMQLHVLDPDRVLPMVTPSGDVYYQLGIDNLAGLQGNGVMVPADEIIHDRFNCLFHPLVGISPLYAACIAAGNGLAIQKNSSTFFSNASTPGGIISVPGEISQDVADKLREAWNTRYSGPNAGKIAILNGGMTYSPTRATATDSQMLEQLKMTAQIICSVFHVPAYKIGMDAAPSSKLSGEALEIGYLVDCLQTHIENMETCLTEGLSLPADYRASLDIDGLTRMDTAEKATAITELVRGGVMTPNEARMKFNLSPVKGGDTVYLQQQDFSIEALAQRDSMNPLGQPPAPVAPPVPAVPIAMDDEQPTKAAALLSHALIERFTKELECV